MQLIFYSLLYVVIPLNHLLVLMPLQPFHFFQLVAFHIFDIYSYHLCLLIIQKFVILYNRKKGKPSIFVGFPFCDLLGVCCHLR